MSINKKMIKIALHTDHVNLRALIENVIITPGIRWRDRGLYVKRADLEDTDVVTNPLFLVLRNALCYPCNVADFLQVKVSRIR